MHCGYLLVFRAVLLYFANGKAVPHPARFSRKPFSRTIQPFTRSSVRPFIRSSVRPFKRRTKQQRTIQNNKHTLPYTQAPRCADASDHGLDWSAGQLAAKASHCRRCHINSFKLQIYLLS